MSAVPEAKIIRCECTVCGCDWQKHLAGPRKKNPTLEDCVRVLKAELAARPRAYPYMQLSGSTNGLVPTAFPVVTARGSYHA